jgi:hypothetical protein
MQNAPATIEEIWKPVPNWPYYEVGNLGRVRSFHKSKYRYLRGSKHRTGHRMIEMARGRNRERTQIFLHKLVAESFIGVRPPELLVRHLNGDPEDNRAANLEYGTVTQNNIERHQHVGSYTGKRSGIRKGVTYESKNRSAYHQELDAAIQASKDGQNVTISMEVAKAIAEVL